MCVCFFFLERQLSLNCYETITVFNTNVNDDKKKNKNKKMNKKNE